MDNRRCRAVVRQAKAVSHTEGVRHIRLSGPDTSGRFTVRLRWTRERTPTMQIFVHTTDGLTLEDVDDGTTVAELAASAGQPDASGWAEDADSPLDGMARVAGAIGDKGHIHISRCHRVTVTVNMAGKIKAREFAPATTITRVRRWTIGEDGFDLPQKERPKHEVGVCGTGLIADRNAHIGTLATDCALCLDLAPKDRFQG